ncbi:MAG: toll/interleukin-1 receptor domain-containing protein [Bryobacteraceae bacterium]
MPSNNEVGRILRACLDTGRSVEMDGLGVLIPKPDGQFEFRAETRPKVFLAYVEEDLIEVRRLADALQNAGFHPWLDKRKLLPGQDWPRSIQQAIEVSDFFVPCFSRRSTYKRGTFQSELRHALECAAEMPLDEIFIVPLRLEPCEVPKRISDCLQYVDVYPNWEKGVNRIIASMRKQMKLYESRRQLLAG